MAGSSLLTWPDEAAVPIDPARLKAAEQADRRLQADVEAVRQREAAFADTLRRLLADGDASFDAMSRAAAAGETHVAKALQGDHSGGVRQSLGAVRAAMTDWSMMLGPAPV